jgi:hypothetical protein
MNTKQLKKLKGERKCKFLSTHSVKAYEGGSGIQLAHGLWQGSVPGGPVAKRIGLLWT